jgi:hypothetical protein
VRSTDRTRWRSARRASAIFLVSLAAAAAACSGSASGSRHRDRPPPVLAVSYNTGPGAGTFTELPLSHGAAKPHPRLGFNVISPLGWPVTIDWTLNCEAGRRGATRKGRIKARNSLRRFLAPTLAGAEDCGLAVLAQLAAHPRGPDRVAYVFAEIIGGP